MKKLLVFGLVIGGLAAMTSCKKNYTCTYDDDSKLEYSSLGKTQAAAQKTICISDGGTWTKD